jgi:TolA-binding protein
MPSWLSLKLIGGLVAALVLLGLVAERSRWMHRAHAAEAQVAQDCAAARKSAANPKMKCDQTDEQIGFLGEAIATLTNAIHRQNDAVTAMGAETKHQQADSAKASEKAAERSKGALATSGRLAASSRSSEAQAKPCEPSKALKGAWQ